MILYYRNITKKLYNESNYGLGMKSFKLIYKNIGLNLEHIHHKNLKLKHIKYLFKNEIRFIFGAKLRNRVISDRKFLEEVNCLKQIRFTLGLPCNGQRTQTNGRTCKLKQNNKVKEVKKKVRFKDDIIAYNLRRRFRHSRRQVRIVKPKEIKNKRRFGDVYKKPEKKHFFEVKKEQRSRIIRNIWTRIKKAKKIKKHLKFKAKKLQNRKRKKRK